MSFKKRLRDYEHQLIVQALEAHYYNRAAAGRYLGLNRTSLVMRIEALRRFGYVVKTRQEYRDDLLTPTNLLHQMKENLL